MNASLKDDIHYHGCDYVRKSYNYFHKEPSQYLNDAEDILPIVKDKIGEAFNLS